MTIPYLLMLFGHRHQFLATHAMRSIGFIPNLVSVFCRRYFLNTTCYCIFCKQIQEYYLCLKDLDKPCKAEFKNFKGLCRHFQKAHQINTPYNKYPRKAREKIQNHFCRVQKRRFQQWLAHSLEKCLSWMEGPGKPILSVNVLWQLNQL